MCVCLHMSVGMWAAGTVSTRGGQNIAWDVSPYFLKRQGLIVACHTVYNGLAGPYDSRGSSVSTFYPALDAPESQTRCLASCWLTKYYF